MKKIAILILVLITASSSNNAFAAIQQSATKGVDIEMFILRKGVAVSIALFSRGTDSPAEFVIERKSDAPLSNYRRILTLSAEQLTELREKGKLLLEDSYPESRQLDSYYRMVYTTKEGALRNMPGIFLSKAAGNTGVTFGDHKQDELMFKSEADLKVYTYEGFNLIFKIHRKDSKVLLTVNAANTNLTGDWAIERKSSAPLASYRKIKIISGEDLQAILSGERVFLDAYPESRKLDTYYRLVITDKDGVRLELPSLFLEGDGAN